MSDESEFSMDYFLKPMKDQIDLLLTANGNMMKYFNDLELAKKQVHSIILNDIAPFLLQKIAIRMDEKISYVSDYIQADIKKQTSAINKNLDYMLKRFNDIETKCEEVIAAEKRQNAMIKRYFKILKERNNMENESEM